jgi:hypothetical protein
VAWSDVTDDVTKGCSGSTCTVDITQMPDWKGQTLRVEFGCSCGAGYKAERDKVTKACVPCDAGTYKKLGMPDCEVCPEGRAQPRPGQVSTTTP